MQRQITKTYSGHKDFDKDSKQLLKEGWRIVNVSEVKQPAGIGRIAALGLGALVVKPKSAFYVTYAK